MNHSRVVFTLIVKAVIFVNGCRKMRSEKSAESWSYYSSYYWLIYYGLYFHPVGLGVVFMHGYTANRV